MTPFELGILFATFYAFYLDVWQLFGIISFDHIIQCNCDRTHQFQYLLPQYLVQFSIHHDLDIFSPKTSPDNKVIYYTLCARHREQ